MVTEIDYMEYSTNALALAAYVPSGTAIKLIGNDNTNTTQNGKDAFLLAKFTADYTGVVTSIRSRGNANGNIKVAIYSDNAGSPNARLAIGTTTAVTANVTVACAVTPTLITAGTAYWIGMNTSQNGVNCRNNTGSTGTFIYKTSTYSTFTFPDPAGTGFTSTTYLCNNALYGIRLVPYSEGTIKTQGTYSLKGVAYATNSLNATLTKTL
jgi:hypothetical protein